MAGMESCPTGRPLVKSSVEAAKRKLARPVQPKEPLFERSDFEEQQGNSRKQDE